jgi:transcriptional regulator with XRE-family HTH domain
MRSLTEGLGWRKLDPDAEAFGQRLRARRHALALSQPDLERETGIPKARISKYEHGHAVPSVPTLVKLADQLDVSLDALTAGLFRHEASELRNQ